ncbi:hypothetical protein Hanom_Chr01g00072791 [Helianthus anomalus]
MVDDVVLLLIEKIVYERQFLFLIPPPFVKPPKYVLQSGNPVNSQLVEIVLNIFPFSLINSIFLIREFKRELAIPYSSSFHHSANLNHW